MALHAHPSVTFCKGTGTVCHKHQGPLSCLLKQHWVGVKMGGAESRVLLLDWVCVAAPVDLYRRVKARLKAEEVPPQHQPGPTLK